MEGIVVPTIPQGLLMFDPLDGSSNIDMSIGTIFSVPKAEIPSAYVATSLANKQSGGWLFIYGTNSPWC